MRMPTRSSWLLLTGSLSMRTQAQTPPSSLCPQDIQQFCAREGNRYCYLEEAQNFRPTCGNCLPGFIEWKNRCVSEQRIDILLYLEEYRPNYVSNLSNQERAQILADSIRFIAQYENENPPLPFRLGLNQFSADAPEDRQALLGFTPDALPADGESLPDFLSPPSSAEEEEEDPLPTLVDWVSVGAVTSVKDQGRCGCCWANALTGAIEGAAAIESNFLRSLSFQQFISCDPRNYGCDGGSLVNGMAFPVLDGNGLADNNQYPFTDSSGRTTEQCDTSASVALELSEANYVINYEDDLALSYEDRMARMKEAVSRQPVAMVMKSGCSLFSNYKSGILTVDDGCECNSALCADHAVLMVGYNDEADIPYWTIKNSWGTGWGENGYVRIAQTEAGNYGLFGILTHGIVPDLTGTSTNRTVSESTGSVIRSDDPVLEWWAWLLIVLAAIVCIFVIGLCMTSCYCPRKKSEEEA